MALGVFAGEAYPQLPITSDYAAAKTFIDALSAGMVTMQGTDIAAAIDLGCKSFTQDKDVGKAIILITDGENHEGGAEEAAKAAAKAGINVYVIGVGTTQGSEIPTANGPLTDANGQVVHTALNEQMCRDIAQAGKDFTCILTKAIVHKTNCRHNSNNLSSHLLQPHILHATSNFKP